MTKMDLLLTIFLEEKNDEGIVTLKKMLGAVDEAQLTLFVDGKKRQIEGVSVSERISTPFNLIEGALSMSDGSSDIRRLDIRYRPAISSRAWAQLGAASDPTSLMDAAWRVHSQEEAEAFQLFLSLSSFEKASRQANNTHTAVFEALHYSLVPARTIELTIVQAFQDSYPEMLKSQIWGYADSVPFRNLSSSEEWSVAKASTMWPDLAISKDSLHQYMFATPSAQPKVAVPPSGVAEGDLAIYRLPIPPWAHSR